jgi:hypothetical protein
MNHKILGIVLAIASALLMLGAAGQAAAQPMNEAPTPDASVSLMSLYYTKRAVLDATLDSPSGCAISVHGDFAIVKKGLTATGAGTMTVGDRTVPATASITATLSGSVTITMKCVIDGKQIVVSGVIKASTGAATGKVTVGYLSSPASGTFNMNMVGSTLYANGPFHLSSTALDWVLFGVR